MSKNIYVIAETNDGEIQKVSFELIGKAKELADDLNQKVIAVLLGHNIKEKAQSLIDGGADEVIFIDDKMLKDYVTEPYTKAVSKIIKVNDPEIVLFGASSIGRDLAPRVSARIYTGLTADCTGLEIDSESKLLMMTRPAFGGNIMATIVCENHRPQMATVRPGVMTALEKKESREGTIQEFPIEFKKEDMNIKIREILKRSKKTVDITEANVLVSGGRGLGDKKGFDKLKKLSEVLGGEISSSRANVDEGWIEKDYQVGQTGKTVRPDLYIATGISGAIQHLAGMEESEFIIAINKDNEAPIFEISDLGIVGDLHDIVPKLTEEINKYKNKSQTE